MVKFICMLAIYFAAGQIAVGDEFRKVRCGLDIPGVLIGRLTSNERTIEHEKRYSHLGLKHLGADEISGRLSSVNWQICSKEFVLLIDHHGLVSDALLFPAHSKLSPAFGGICQMGGRNLPDIILAILDGTTNTTKLLPVLSAWKIDQRLAKFIKVANEGVLCPRSGIYTVDGGQ